MSWKKFILVIDLVVDHAINISEHNHPLNGNSCIKLPK